MKEIYIFYTKIKQKISFGNRELSEIFVTEGIRSFGKGMLNIFIPLYLINLGYSLKVIVLMYLLESIFHILFVIPATKISCKLGFKKMNFISTFAYMAFVYLLIMLPSFRTPLFVLALLKQISDVFYAIWYHTQATRSTNEGKRGIQLGVKDLISGIVGLPAPLIGGLILAFMGIKVLGIVVLIVFALSTLPLYFSYENKIRDDLSVKEVFVSKKLRHAIVFMVHGIDNMLNDFVWPVFIFLNITNKYEVLGVASFLGNIFSLAMNVIIGKLVDINKKLMLSLGGIIEAILWIIKSFTKSIYGLFVLNSASGISNTMISLSFGARSYDIANETGDGLPFIIFREIMIHSGRLILYTGLYLLANWIYAIWAGAGLYLLYTLF
ncbi:MAG: MFS transporter [Candidatus Paceibacterota bacterium]|jgi:hypothetical protein